MDKAIPILFSFLILDQEEHGQAKTMRKSSKWSVSNAFSMTIINSHPTKKIYDELADHDTELKFKIDGNLVKEKNMIANLLEGHLR